MKTQKRVNRTAVFISLLLCGITVFWGVQASAEEWTEAQKEVWKAVKAGWETILKADLEALGAGFDEGVLIWWPSQPEPFGKDTMKIRYNSWFGWNKPVSYEIEPIAIGIIGDVSTVFYFYKWTGDKQPDTVVRGRQFETYIKQNGKWKFAGAMGCSCDTTPLCF